MTTTSFTRLSSTPDSAVIEWLMEGDPAIRWQTMQDVMDAPPEQVTVERARVATEGVGAQLLALQGEDGSWGGVTWNHGWDSTMHVLTMLRELGLDPASEKAQRAVGLVRDNVRWKGWDWDGLWKGWDFSGNPYFAGETEPCINGQVAASGAYFGQDSERIIDRLLNEQLSDGGWNCDAPDKSNRGSFNTTICVLEALLEYELAGGTRPEVTEARLRGEEYLLARGLMRRQTTGDIIDQHWLRFSFPNWWHYDVLRGLDYLRHAGVTPEERLAEVIALVESKRGNDGRWLMDYQHPGTMLVELDEGEGKPSRWITLRALRVLKWYAGRA